MKCKDCKYFDNGFFNQQVGGYEDDEIAPHCRRHAPTILCGTGSGWSNQLFPKVSPEDWCGEFEERK